MSTWQLEIQKNRVIIKGLITMPDLNTVLNKYCKTHWVIDPDEAEKIGANFVIKEPEYAINQ